jgi:hypothetical protein
LTNGQFNDRKPAAVRLDQTSASEKIQFFWARDSGNGQRLFTRTKPDFDFNADNWSAEQELEMKANIPANTFYEDAEPHVLINPAGNLELYWRSSRTGVDLIWTRVFDFAKNAWQPEEQISAGAETCLAPTAAYWPDGKLGVWYRSPQSVLYTSAIYPNMKTLDHRYAGAATVDTRNRNRVRHLRRWEDNQAYTYDTGKANENWYSHNTVGIYLTPDTEDEQLLRRFQQILQGVLPRFLPLTLRAVVVINPPVYTEYFYTYDFPHVKPQREIGEHVLNAPTDVVHDALTPIAADFRDRMQTWRWARTWTKFLPDTRTGNKKDRTYYTGMQTGRPKRSKKKKR